MLKLLYIYDYFDYNKILKGSINKSEKINYPFCSLLNEKRIEEISSYLKNNFDIAGFAIGAVESNPP